MHLQYQPVLLEWLDSEAQVGWQYIGNLPKDYKGNHIQSIGYLVMENDEVVIITTSVSQNDGAMDVLAIPKCAVLSRRVVNVNEA